MECAEMGIVKVFLGCAAGVYGLALTYCYLTGHFMEMGIIGGVMAGLAVFFVNIFRTI